MPAALGTEGAWEVAEQAGAWPFFILTLGFFRYLIFPLGEGGQGNVDAEIRV